LDSLLYDYIARPVMGVFERCDAIERRWTDFLSGGKKSRESDRLEHSAGSLEDL
jgi:NAD(P)H-quinone oxidoreductase subunit 5